MRHIPEYYPISYDEYIQSCKLEGKEPDATVTPEYLEQVEIACNNYKIRIIQAIQAAISEEISPHLYKNIVYSRTWGKN